MQSKISNVGSTSVVLFSVDGRLWGSDAQQVALITEQHQRRIQESMADVQRRLGKRIDAKSDSEIESWAGFRPPWRR